MNIQGTLRSILGVPYFETSPCAELLQGMHGQTSPFLGMDPLGDLKAKRFQAVKVSPKTFLWFQSLKSLQYLYLQKIYRKSMNTCLFGYKLEKTFAFKLLFGMASSMQSLRSSGPDSACGQVWQEL